MSQYLDLAYAVVVDERVRGGAKLYDALEETKSWAASRTAVPAVTARGNTTEAPPRPPDQGVSGIGGPGEPVTATDLANRDAMAVLTGAMKSVDGGFR